MKAKRSLLIGIALVLLAILWLFTPLSDQVLAGLRNVFGAPQRSGTERTFLWDYLPLVFNGLSAFFGAMGVYLTAKNGPIVLQKPKQRSKRRE